MNENLKSSSKKEDFHSGEASFLHKAHKKQIGNLLYSYTTKSSTVTSRSAAIANRLSTQGRLSPLCH